MDMKKILQALDGVQKNAVGGINDMKQFVSIVKEANTVPPMPDITGLRPGQPKDLGDGSKVEVKQDGTVHYAGAWGTYVYNAQGQHVKTISPSIGGYSQQTDPTGKVTQQNYNQGPLSIKKGPEGDEAEYDLGIAKVSSKTPAGATKPAQGSIAVREMSFKDYLVQIEEGLKDPKDNPCWKGYKPVGTKKKGGRTVPNCVPKK